MSLRGTRQRRGRCFADILTLIHLWLTTILDYQSFLALLLCRVKGCFRDDIDFALARPCRLLPLSIKFFLSG
jgi:hypothetical protein